MPKRRTVRSLEQLCLENVAKNIRRIWALACAESHLDGHGMTSVAEPYICLPDLLLQKLFALMEEGDRLIRPVLRFLLAPQLTMLSLRKCPRLVIKGIADTIALRCRNLSSLDIAGCQRISAGSLVNLVKALPNLYRLNLSQTLCNAQVLAAVGSHCQQLLELDILDCRRLSPKCLLHLAYNPATGSFLCPALQVLRIGKLWGRPLLHDMLRPLIFLLLALRRLTVLEHDFIPEAVCAIYGWHLDNAPLAPEFPTLWQLASYRMCAHHGCGLTLSLTQLKQVAVCYLPVAFAMCPRLTDLSLVLRGNPGFGQDFAAWRHISALGLDNDSHWDIEDLLPMAAALGPQLVSLSLSGFFCEDAYSFWTLLGHCPNIRQFWADLPSPATCDYDSDEEDMVEEIVLEENARPKPHQFPHLWYFFLMRPDTANRLPSLHKAVFSACLVSLLRHAPQLESLLLANLPFSLDKVFEQVLCPPGRALTRLRKLSLIEALVSGRTIHLLLSSENQLSFLDVPASSCILRTDYDDFLRRIRNEGLELTISWE